MLSWSARESNCAEVDARKRHSTKTALANIVTKESLAENSGHRTLCTHPCFTVPIFSLHFFFVFFFVFGIDFRFIRNQKFFFQISVRLLQQKFSDINLLFSKFE